MSGPHETLDPQDWSAFRALSHRALDDALDFVSTLGSRPPWQPVPPGVREALAEPVPLEGQGEEAVFRQFFDLVLPYSNGNRHPRFWGWVQGCGTPVGMVADLLASSMNPHMGGFQQAPALVEEQVISWMSHLMGFPLEASGLLVSGGTMANVLGLAVARYARAGFDVRREGLQGGHPRLLFYGSAETHGWAIKGAEFLGLGSAAYRGIAARRDGTVDLEALEVAVQEDRAAGHRPFCVVGTAGTVNTGAIDPLDALADFCAREDLWFHVDGAFGALAHLSDTLRPLVKGIGRADSLAFDLHKWGSLPFEIACVLVRDRSLHEGAFRTSAPYLLESERGVIAGGLPFADRGLELTRGFKALKVWMSLKVHGVRALARIIEQNVRHVRALGAEIEQVRELELLAPVTLNVACFRFNPGGLSDPDLDAVNQELLLRLQESGAAVISGTWWEGRFALRVAHVNHRSRWEDFEALLAAILGLGREIAGELA